MKIQGETYRKSQYDAPDGALLRLMSDAFDDCADTPPHCERCNLSDKCFRDWSGPEVSKWGNTRLTKEEVERNIEKVKQRKLFKRDKYKTGGENESNTRYKYR